VLFPESTPFTCEKRVRSLPQSAPSLTSQSFIRLCTGSQPPVTLPGKPARDVKLSYAGSVLHRVIPEFMIQGGDITNGDGTGGLCALDLPDEFINDPLDNFTKKVFSDEAFGWKKLNKAGLVCMANRGIDTNTSQFFITLNAAEWLEERHTVFGEVVSGMDVVRKIENVDVDMTDRPVVDVTIAACGQISHPSRKRKG
jgi:cyclophilin family peptidyl-prolyl cis-trans isomerase